MRITSIKAGDILQVVKTIPDCHLQVGDVFEVIVVVVAGKYHYRSKVTSGVMGYTYRKAHCVHDWQEGEHGWGDNIRAKSQGLMLYPPEIFKLVTHRLTERTRRKYHEKVRQAVDAMGVR